MYWVEATMEDGTACMINLAGGVLMARLHKGDEAKTPTGITGVFYGSSSLALQGAVHTPAYRIRETPEELVAARPVLVWPPDAASKAAAQQPAPTRG
jgi:hypothetical protein